MNKRMFLRTWSWFICAMVVLYFFLGVYLVLFGEPARVLFEVLYGGPQ